MHWSIIKITQSSKILYFTFLENMQLRSFLNLYRDTFCLSYTQKMSGQLRYVNPLSYKIKLYSLKREAVVSFSFIPFKLSLIL